MSHRRNGKVARLPRAAREQVNLLLDDGKTYAEIIQWLSANGFPGFNGENIRQWKNGGFQDWLNHHEELGLIEPSARQEDKRSQEEPAPDGAFLTNSKQFKPFQTKK